MAQNETLALVATAVDKASGPLRQISQALVQLKKEGDLSVHGKSVAGFSKELDRLGRASRDLQPAGKHVLDFGRRWKEVQVSIGETSKGISKELMPSLSALGLGMIGATASIGGAIEALKKFGESGQNLLNLSRQTGIAVKVFDEYDIMAKRAGLSTEEMRASLTGLGSLMAELRKPGGGPLFAGALTTRGAEQWGRTVKGVMEGVGTETEKTTKVIELSMDLIRSTTNAQGVATGRLVAEQLHLPKIFADLSQEMSKTDWDRYVKGALAVRGTLDAAKIRAYTQSTGELDDAMIGLQRTIGNELLPSMTALNVAVAEWIGHNKEGIATGLRTEMEGIRSTVAEVIALYGKLKEVIAPFAAPQPKEGEGRGEFFKRTWKDRLGIKPGGPTERFFNPENAAPPTPAPGGTFDDRFGSWDGGAVPPATEAQHLTQADIDNLPALGGPGGEGEYGGSFKPNVRDGNFGMSDAGAAGFSANVDDRRSEDANTTATRDNTAELKKITDAYMRSGPMTGGIASQLGMPGTPLGQLGTGAGSGNGGGRGGGGGGGGGGGSGGGRSHGQAPSIPPAVMRPLDPKDPNSYDWGKSPGAGPSIPSAPKTDAPLPVAGGDGIDWGQPRVDGGASPQRLTGDGSVDDRAAGKGAGFGGRPRYGSTGDTNPNTAESMDGNGDNVAVSQAVSNQPQTAAMRAVDRMMMLEGKHEQKDTALIRRFLATGGRDMNPAETAWCAATVNSALAQEGVKGTNSDVANSFANYGAPVAPGDVRKGDVLNAMHRAGVNQTGGHVGMATGYVDPDTGKIEMISGNTTGPETGGRSLIAGRGMYDPRTLNIRRPPDATGPAMAQFDMQGQGPTQVAQSGSREGDIPARFASVRYNNPGAQYPGASSKMFGSTGTEIIGGGQHKIAVFPTPVHGAASNFRLLQDSDKYVGQTISQAMKNWSGGSRSVPGPGGKAYDPNTIITREMTQDPAFAVPFMKTLATGEAPGNYPMDDAQWQQAHQWAMAGGVPEGQQALARGDDPNTAVAATGGAPARLKGAVPYADQGGGAGQSGGVPGGFETTAGPNARFAVQNQGSRIFAADRSQLQAARQSQIVIPDDDHGAGMGKASGKGIGQDYSSQADYLARPAGELSAANEMTHKVEGSGSIKVDVNAPRGTKVSGEGGGMFKEVEVRRTAPMTQATQSTGGEAEE